jgi:hypothetical protein
LLYGFFICQPETLMFRDLGDKDMLADAELAKNPMISLSPSVVGYSLGLDLFSSYNNSSAIFHFSYNG